MSKAAQMKEFEQRIAKIEAELKSLRDDFEAYKLSQDGTATEVASKSVAGSQAKAQSGAFPYPVGEVVKVAFPELFKRKLLNAGDVAYLLSSDATKDFKTRGYPILRIYTTEDDPGLYACNHRRFYKMKPLELGVKKYHLSSQFFPESRQAVLSWIYAHGLKRNDLVAAIEARRKAPCPQRIKRSLSSLPTVT